MLAIQYLQFAKLVVVSLQRNKVSRKNTKSAEVVLEIEMILQVHQAANNNFECHVQFSVKSLQLVQLQPQPPPSPVSILVYLNMGLKGND